MRKLGKEYIVVPESGGLVNFNRMVSFNDTAARLWEAVSGKEFTVEDLKGLILSKYDTDEDTARADAVRLAREWTEAGLVAE